MSNLKFSEKELVAVKHRLNQMMIDLSTSTENVFGEMKKMMDNSYSDPNDRATLESERSIDIRLQQRGKNLKSKIEKAIQRIDGGEYQVCENCGEEISKERLLARPVTDLCIHCKENQERSERLKTDWRPS